MTISMTALIIVFVVTVVFGVPVAFCLGLAGLAFILLSPTLPANIMPTIMFGAVDSFPLMAIPFFIMAGDVISRAGILPRLIDFADALVGHFRGGLAQVTIIATLFFAGVTGVALAEAAAVGAMLIPSMVRQGYSAPYAAALVSSSSVVGAIIPPSVGMIIFAHVYGSGISVGKMFLCGDIPGLMIIAALMISVYIQSYYKTAIPKVKKFQFANVVRTFPGALLGLMVPVIIRGGIISGMFTPTESGAVAVMYGLLVGFFITRNLTLNDVKESVLRSCKASCVVMILMATAKIISWILISHQIPHQLAQVFTAGISSPQVFLLVSMGIFLLLGFVMEGLAIMIMLTPVLGPLAVTYGIDPHVFGLLVVMTVQIALITPPVALALFIVTPLANCTVMEAAKEIWMFLSAIALVIVLIIFFPEIALWLPSKLGY